jgi:hypothetical protein
MPTRERFLLRQAYGGTSRPDKCLVVKAVSEGRFLRCYFRLHTKRIDGLCGLQPTDLAITLLSMSLLRKRLLLAFGILLLIVGGAFAYAYIRLWSQLPESYAAWTSGNAFVDYLQEHTNHWPRNWDELRSATNRSLWYVPVERLKEVVKIDWQTDVGQLAEAARRDSNLKIHVVTRLDGKPLKAVWGPDTEPNTKILEYLRTQTNPVP